MFQIKSSADDQEIQNYYIWVCDFQTWSESWKTCFLVEPFQNIVLIWRKCKTFAQGMGLLKRFSEDIMKIWSEVSKSFEKWTEQFSEYLTTTKVMYMRNAQCACSVHGGILAHAQCTVGSLCYLFTWPYLHFWQNQPMSSHSLMRQLEQKMCD